MSKELNSIESQMEETRERLASTIDQLVYRTSPKTIATKRLEATKALFVGLDGKPRMENIAKVGGAVAGVVAVGVVLRLVTR